jgi:xanthine dehydrogenase YagS FAD-binding subunit
MRPFSFSRELDLTGLLRDKTDTAAFLGGGTNLVDLMKKGIAEPDRVLYTQGSGLSNTLQGTGSGMTLGALMTNSAVAAHPEIQQQFPLLSKAILAGASPQIRNMATTAGNLLQRTRCPYFYNTSLPCNKREPGTGCSALQGTEQRMNAIIGWSQTCVAVHPSDMCVALTALDAQVLTESKTGGPKAIPFDQFHRLPETDATRDSNLPTDAVITGVQLAANRFSKHSAYVKVRDRTSYAFALVSVAAALELDGATIRQVRLASGGVAHKPWRWIKAEQYLTGKKATPEQFAKAADLVLAETKPLTHNGFKKSLLRGAFITALEEATQGV